MDLSLVDLLNTGLNGGGLALAIYVLQKVQHERMAAWTILAALIQHTDLSHLKALFPRQFQNLFDDQ